MHLITPACAQRVWKSVPPLGGAGAGAGAGLGDGDGDGDGDGAGAAATSSCAPAPPPHAEANAAVAAIQNSCLSVLIFLIIGSKVNAAQSGRTPSHAAGFPKAAQWVR